MAKKIKKGDLSVAFRRAAAKDIPAVEAIQNIAFAGQLNQEDMKGYAPILEAAVAEDGFYLVVAAANDNNEQKVVGYVLVNAFSYAAAKLAEIAAVAVDVDWKGKGIGRRLMEEAEEVMRKEGFETSRLMVWDQNKTAQVLYTDLGYQQADSVPQYYRNGGTGLLMQKRLI